MSETILSNVSFQINKAYEYESLIIAGGFYDMAIFNPATNELLEIDTIGINQVLEYDGKLMICVEEGLCSLDSEQKIRQEANERCYSVPIAAQSAKLELF